MTVLVAERQLGRTDALPSLQARLACRAGHGHHHRRRRQRLCPGQSGDPAGKTRRRLSPLLPAQSKTVSDHRHVRCRQSPDSRARARSRHPHRRAALSRLARRRGGGGADRHHGALARRPRHLRARMLVFVRGSADGGRPADPPHRAQGAGADVPHQYRLRSAGPFAGPMVVSMRPFKPADAIRAVQITSRFPPCMARRCISAIRIRSGLPISRSPTMGTQCRSSRRNSGVLGLRRHPASGDRSRKTALCDYPCSRPDAGDGLAQQTTSPCFNGQPLPLFEALP